MMPGPSVALKPLAPVVAAAHEAKIGPGAELGIDISGMAQVEQIGIKMKIKRITQLKDENQKLEAKIEMAHGGSSTSAEGRSPTARILLKIVDVPANVAKVASITLGHAPPAITEMVTETIGRSTELSLRVRGQVGELNEGRLEEAFESVLAGDASAVCIVAV
jgi:hypothetical protein